MLECFFILLFSSKFPSISLFDRPLNQRLDLAPKMIRAKMCVLGAEELTQTLGGGGGLWNKWRGYWETCCAEANIQ